MLNKAIARTMSPQQKTGGGSRKTSGKGAGGGQKDSAATVAEQSNTQNSTNNKKHTNVSSTVNNNNNIDQGKTEKEKPHIKVSYSYIFFFSSLFCSFRVYFSFPIHLYVYFNTIATVMMIIHRWCFSFCLFTVKISMKST